MKLLLALSRHAETAPARRALAWLKLSALMVFGCAAVASASAQTALADRPLFATQNVPGNLVLALSVEFPTAVTAADRSLTYSKTSRYLGYFDPTSCYTYIYKEAVNGSYFSPITKNGANDFSCSGKWSGNFLNWATMQAIDPFRWALTGGYRSIDSDTTTILEKAIAPSGQGSPTSNFPHKTLTADQTSATPFSTNMYMQVLNCGNRLLFRRSNTAYTNNSACPAATEWDGNLATVSGTTVYSLEVRVKVCASAALKEDNCVQYGSNYKPQGLIQKYAQKIRYSAFGYLTDPPDGSTVKLRDGGVLRARMKFVGPTQPVPGSTPIPNVKAATLGQITTAEWSATTGVFVGNPDEDDAKASDEPNSLITNSGVINYLNQFGRGANAYKRYDNVSELYYAATRYLRGLKNVPEYTDLSNYNGPTTPSILADRTRMKDGFPVISNWTDPILYSCQKNFVLGIGDTNTHADKNLPGNKTSYRTNEPAMPDAVDKDPINVIEATNKVGVLEGLTPTTIGNTNGYTGTDNSAYIAGMAYLFNTTDIRSDLVDKQTISTYWLDVLESSDYKGGNGARNQFYLAAKYGGFTVADNYVYASATAALPKALWSTTGDTLSIPTAGGPRPDNFFLANQADKMVSGLEAAFLKIASTVAAYTTSFSTSLPQVATSGNSSFSSQYDPGNWTGEVSASELNFDSNGVPTVVKPPKWNFTDKLTAQLAGTGWNSNRRVITWDGTIGGGGGVAFRSTGTSRITPSDLSALNPSYTTASDSADYLDYLRGRTLNEQGGSGTDAYRARTKLLGDIVGSKARPVGPPSFPYSDTTNPDYSAFKTLWKTRRTVVYVGSNDGMMHAINGALVTVQPSPTPVPPLEQSPDAGTELFAYVPKALFQGPNGTPNVDGLASLGNPSYVHHFMVNATPSVYDIDFARTADATGVPPTNNPTAEWHSVLIGGLGKGGRSYYALDVTNPVGMAANEAAAASKVLWEFNNTTTGPGGTMAGELGYTYGEPIVVKTRKYGWVVIFASGYNNTDGQGYFLFVNPRTGALLEKVGTGLGAVASDAGLAHANAFVVDATDGTADSVYAGDLLGNLWRLDLTALAGTGAYPAPTKLAELTDATIAKKRQPVTSRPSIEVHPRTKERFVLVGTGRLLDDTDISSSQGQTFYAIADGTNAQFKPTGAAAPLNFPYTRSVLANDANALAGVKYDPTTQAGWFEELGSDSATSIAWRVTSDSTTLAGSVAFATTLPNGQACNPSGNSRVYGRDYATAKTTVQKDVSGTLAPTLYVELTGNVTDLRYLSVGGQAVLVAGTDVGKVSKVEINPLDSIKLRRLNWRELQLAD